MGCLIRCISSFINIRNNRIYPIDTPEPTRQFEDSLNVSNRLVLSARETRVNNEMYSNLSTREIINLIGTIHSPINLEKSTTINEPDIVNVTRVEPIRKKPNKTCPICLEKIVCERKYKTLCKNKQCKACYHKNCINEWAKTKETNDISCLLCTLKTIKVKGATVNRHNSRPLTNQNAVYSQYNNRYNRYNNPYYANSNSNYQAGVSNYSYYPPNTR
tara:strand:- start:596 stop:1246 length:651 start_codon:yes stop_codon:yes gene_type:complete